MRTAKLGAMWVVFAGCGASVGSTDAGAMNAGQPDAGVAAGCRAGSHEVDGGGCASTLTWAHAGVTVPPRDHHSSLIIERAGRAFLYVLGGTDRWVTLHDSVLRAEIASDGSLAAFETLAPLPEVRAGLVAVELDGALVVTGGLTETAQGRYVLASTLAAKILDDGTLGPWAEGPALPEAVMHHTCNVVSHRMYCFGGRIAGNFTGTLAVSTTLDAHGDLTPYAAASALPHGLGFQQSFTFGAALFLAGGLRRDPATAGFTHLTEIWRAVSDEHGELGPWESAGTLPESLNVGAAVTFLNRVYFVGGMNGDDRVEANVRAAVLSDAGTLVDFEVLPDAPRPARMHVHQTPRHRTWLYEVGGRLDGDVSTSSVEIGTFD